MKRLTWLAVFAILACADPAHAVPDSVYAGINERAVQQHILPRYGQLAVVTGKLDAAAKTFCAAPAVDKLDAVRKTYNEVEDAWQNIQHVRFGPAANASRADRFAFWPDPRNIIGKQMAALLAKRDAAALVPEKFAHASVALQGLPALERLVFTDQAEKLTAKSVEAVFRCQYLQAIAGNLAAMATQIDHEWRDGASAFATRMTQPNGTPYRDPREANVDLFKSLYFAVELAADHKLARPLGGSAQEARPHLAESWRSLRSLRNLQLNLEAARNLYLTAFAPAMPDKGTAEGIRASFDEAIAAANEITLPLENAVQDGKARPAVEKLARSIVALKKILLHLLPAELDIPVGFNALDGD